MGPASVYPCAWDIRVANHTNASAAVKPPAALAYKAGRVCREGRPIADKPIPVVVARIEPDWITFDEPSEAG